MNYKVYQIDTFTDKVFAGNPACVVPLKEWLSDDLLLKIAKENAVAETAYFIYNEDEIHLRWFTPDLEIDLCGHATLATAYVLQEILKYPLNKIQFKTLSGKLTVTYKQGFYYLDFPSRNPKPAILPEKIRLSLSIQPQEVFRSRDYMLVYENEEEIREIKINRHFLIKLI